MRATDEALRIAHQVIAAEHSHGIHVAAVVIDRLLAERRDVAEAVWHLKKDMAVILSVLAAVDDYNAQNDTHIVGGAFLTLAKRVEPIRAFLATQEAERG